MSLAGGVSARSSSLDAPGRLWAAREPCVGLGAFLPFCATDLGGATAWLQSVADQDRNFADDLAQAAERLSWHDRYAGILGFLPDGLDDLLAAAAVPGGRPDRDRRFRAAEVLAQPGVRGKLFDGAFAAWKATVRARAGWWAVIDDRVINAEADRLAQKMFEA